MFPRLHSRISAGMARQILEALFETRPVNFRLPEEFQLIASIINIVIDDPTQLTDDFIQKYMECSLTEKSFDAIYNEGLWRPAELTPSGGAAVGKWPWDFSISQINQGIDVEHEHTDSGYLAMLIAMDHLAEIPDYYTHLANMEHEAVGELQFREIHVKVGETFRINYTEKGDSGLKWEFRVGQQDRHLVKYVGIEKDNAKLPDGYHAVFESMAPGFVLIDSRQKRGSWDQAPVTQVFYRVFIE